MMERGRNEERREKRDQSFRWTFRFVRTFGGRISPADHRKYLFVVSYLALSRSLSRRVAMVMQAALLCSAVMAVVMALCVASASSIGMLLTDPLSK